jgi:hypothetical protein
MALRDDPDFKKGAWSNQLGNTDGGPSRIRLLDEFVFDVDEHCEVLPQINVVCRQVNNVLKPKPGGPEMYLDKPKRISKLRMRVTRKRLIRPYTCNSRKEHESTRIDGWRKMPVSRVVWKLRRDDYPAHVGILYRLGGSAPPGMSAPQSQLKVPAGRPR